MPCGNISLYFNVLKVYGWALVSACPESAVFSESLELHASPRVSQGRSHASGHEIAYPAAQ